MLDTSNTTSRTTCD